jgi:hypothetical protein
MFGSEFIERLESRNEFTFNTEAEACSEEDFIKFLVPKFSVDFFKNNKFSALFHRLPFVQQMRPRGQCRKLQRTSLC